MREEKSMLNANISGLIMAVVFILPAYFIYRSVLMVALGTLLAMVLRLYLSEYYLKRKLYLVYFSNIKLEILVLLVFILCAYQNNKLLGLFGYLTFLCGYLLFNRRSLSSLLKIIRFTKG